MDADCVTAQQMATRIQELRVRYTDILFEETMAGRNVEKTPRLKKLRGRIESLMGRYGEVTTTGFLTELQTMFTKGD